MKVRHSFVKWEDMKKNFRFIIVGFFILCLFTTLLSLQEYSTFPSWYCYWLCWYIWTWLPASKKVRARKLDEKRQIHFSCRHAL